MHMNLAKIRKARKLSQRDLAAMIDVDAATVNRAEAMADSAMLKTYTKCAEALGVTLVDIFGDERTATELALLRAFRKIPADQHQRILGLLELAESQPPT